MCFDEKSSFLMKFHQSVTAPNFMFILFRQGIFMSPQYGRKKPHLARIIIRLFNELEVALLAARHNILNVSAFARIIQPQVEKIAQRKVGVKTISMTLLRYLKEQQIKFSFPVIFVKEIQELGLRYGHSMIKIKFDRQSQTHPNRFYVVLARLAIYKIVVVKLSVFSGVLTIWVKQQQAGLALIILRSLMKREKQFKSRIA